MLETTLVFALLLSSPLSAQLCEERLDVVEERIDSLAREVGSLAATVEGILQTVREGMLLQRKMSLGRHVAVEGTLGTDNEEKNIDDSGIDNVDYIFPLMNDTNLEKRVAILELHMSNVLEDVTILDAGLMDHAEDVETQITIIQADITFIQADQTTQDQRLFDVEEEVETVEADVIELDSRVIAMEC